MNHAVTFREAGVVLTLDGVNRYPLSGAFLSVLWLFDGRTLKLVHSNWRTR